MGTAVVVLKVAEYIACGPSATVAGGYNPVTALPGHTPTRSSWVVPVYVTSVLPTFVTVEPASTAKVLRAGPRKIPASLWLHDRGAIVGTGVGVGVGVTNGAGVAPGGPLKFGTSQLPHPPLHAARDARAISATSPPTWKKRGVLSMFIVLPTLRSSRRGRRMDHHASDRSVRSASQYSVRH